MSTLLQTYLTRLRLQLGLLLRIPAKTYVLLYGQLFPVHALLKVIPKAGLIFRQDAMTYLRAQWTVRYLAVGLDKSIKDYSPRLVTYTGLLALILVCSQKISAQGTLPMQKGMVVISCFSGNGNSAFTAQNPDGPVLAIFDIRDPQGNGAPTNPPSNWTSASAGGYHPANWTAAQMGELFGVALEEGAEKPTIFATTTGLTANGVMQLNPKTGGTGGEVFRVNGTTGVVTTLVTLPNTIFTFSGFSRYVGLGDVTYNRIHNVLYVSNLDNGLVYTVNATTGALLGVPFNHNTAVSDNTSLPFTQVERMVFGLGYNYAENKLYYAVKGGSSLGSNNQIYTIELNADGSINPATKSATPMIDYPDTGSILISDIAFSTGATQMLIAEMGLTMTDGGTGFSIPVKVAHTADVRKYSQSAGNWALTLNYGGRIGVFASGRNAEGGVDFGFNNYGTNSTGTNQDDAAVIGADQLGYPQIFGIQISDISASATYATSYVVDLDNEVEVGQNDKYTTGDLEVFGDVCPIINCFPTKVTKN